MGDGEKCVAFGAEFVVFLQSRYEKTWLYLLRRHGMPGLARSWSCLSHGLGRALILRPSQAPGGPFDPFW